MLDEPLLLKGGVETFDRRLDRVPYQPAANRGWTVQRLVEERDDLLELEAIRRGRGHWPGPGLDQGEEGECVEYGMTHRRNSMPKRLLPAVTDPFAMHEDYHGIQHADPWQGCTYGRRCPLEPGPQYAGTSVHSGMEYGRQKGWWSSYWWVGAGSGDVLGDIVRANRAVGGIVYGLVWLESMFDPRPSGLMEVDRSSRMVGGHCLYGPAVRLKMRLPGEWVGTKEVAVMQQSWGEDYGVADLGRPGGMVYMLLDDVDWLMHHQFSGEGAVVIR